MGDKGHKRFAEKHTNQKINQTIADKIHALSENGGITCSSAHQISKSLNHSPSEIGVQIDLLEFKITQCQLGLFGYRNGKKNINPEIAIPPELKNRLQNTTLDQKISCFLCWEIASDLKLKRLDIGSACEQMNIRIKPCQLGTF